MGELKITVGGIADLRMMARWAADEGWNPGQDDAVAFATADPFGFLIGRVDGEPVSCISVVRYGESFGFLGFYLTREPWRGRGFGMQTWHAGMTRLQGRTVGLDGVVEQQANYRRSGFQQAWTNLRFEGIPDPGDVELPGVSFVDALTLPLDALRAYDRQFFAAPRDSFLACWMALPGRTAVAALKDGELAGLGVLRPCPSGSRVGPWYAQTSEIAACLLRRLAAGASVLVDVPDVNPRAIELAGGLGLKPVFESARMYTGPVPELNHAAFYGVTSLELG